MLKITQIFLTSPNDSDEDIIIVPGKDLHYISFTMGGLTFPVAVLRFRYRLEESVVYDLFRSVDILKETGTLYPNHNVTIIPASKNFSASIKYLKDAIQAQTEYVKARKVIIDMRSGGHCKPEDDENYIIELERLLRLTNNTEYIILRQRTPC